jgi:hypothetical protein
MKCPNCQAKLLPVDGQMFCLQCGEVCQLVADEDPTGPEPESTSDPILQKALNDGLARPLQFRAPPELTKIASETSSPSRSRPAFMPLRQLVAPPQSALAGSGTAGALNLGPQPATPPAITLIKPARSSSGGWQMPRSWIVGLAVFAVFVTSNVGIAYAFQNRVYPGVRVGAASVGNQPAAAIPGLIGEVSGDATLAIRIADESYVLNISDVADYDAQRAQSQAMAIGRDSGLPMLGLLSAWFSRPVALQYKVRPADLSNQVALLAAKAERPAANAWPMALNGQALVVSGHSGLELDQSQLTKEITQALGKQATLRPAVQTIEPSTTIKDFDVDITTAQAILSTPVVVKVRTTAYTLTGSAQISEWLRYGAPGEGVKIDTAAAADYFNSLPGSFDRAAAVNAVVQALNSRTALDYQARTRRNTRASGTTLPRPVVAYSYCVTGEARQLADQAGQALAQPAGWTMGGRVVFTRVDQGCHFTLSLRDTVGLNALNPSCTKQTTCRVGAQLAMAQAAWQSAPGWWKTDQPAYRTELINHEVGHWLGFTHADCNQPDTKPVIGTPSVILNGSCSPEWYAVPAESQDTKVLTGFQ